MRKSLWIGSAVATAATAGALVVGGGTALAATPAPTPAANPNQQICAVRIPELLTKIDKVTARINGDASTKGSTAWLQARETRARAAGHTALADLIAAKVSDRAQRLTELAHIKDEVTRVQSTDCGS